MPVALPHVQEPPHSARHSSSGGSVLDHADRRPHCHRPELQIGWQGSNRRGEFCIAGSYAVSVDFVANGKWRGKSLVPPEMYCMVANTCWLVAGVGAVLQKSCNYVAKEINYARWELRQAGSHCYRQSTGDYAATAVPVGRLMETSLRAGAVSRK